MTQTPPLSKPAPAQSRGFTLFFVGIVLLLAGHFAAAWAPGIAVWGFDHGAGFSLSVRLILIGAALLLFIPRLARLVDRRLDRIAGNWWSTLLLLIIAGALFTVFRSRGYAYGDGYTYLAHFAGGRFPDLVDQLLTHVPDIAVHWVFYNFFVAPAGGSAAASNALLSAAAGVASLAAVIRIASVIAAGRKDVRRFLIAATLTSGSIALWFGYVEAYSLSMAAGLWALSFAVASAKTPARLRWAWVMLALACAFHLKALALVPGVAWAAWCAGHPERPALSRGRSAILVAGGLVTAGIVAAFFHRAGSDVFVPLWPTAESAYAVFSHEHLLDAANLALLIAPLGLVALLVLLLSGPYRPDRSSPDRRYAVRTARGILAVSAVGAWYFAFWVDPLLGAFRDWDLLTGFGIPLTLWGAAALTARFAPRVAAGRLWVGIAAVAVIHSGAWIVSLQDEETAAQRVDTLVRQDMHYSARVRRGERLSSWAAILGVELNRYDVAKDHLGRRATYAPDDAFAWANLGSTYRKLDELDSAASCFDRATALAPGNNTYLANLGLLRMWLKDYSAARTVFEKYVERVDSAYDARVNLGSVYRQLGLPQKADSVLTEAVALQPDRPDAYARLGEGAHVQADTAGAIEYYEAARRHGGGSEEIYKRLTQLYQGWGQRDRAVAVAYEWERRYPGSSAAPFVLGMAFITRQQYDSANTALTRSVVRNPRGALGVYYLATTYRHLGQPEKSLELAERAAILDTMLALPYLEMVYLAADAGDRAGAARAARAYLRRAPADSGMSYLRQFLDQ